MISPHLRPCAHTLPITSAVSAILDAAPPGTLIHTAEELLTELNKSHSPELRCNASPSNISLVNP